MKEALAIVETIAVADEARSGDEDTDTDARGGFIVVVAENHLNNTLIGLIISLLRQDTS